MITKILRYFWWLLEGRALATELRKQEAEEAFKKIYCEYHMQRCRLQMEIHMREWDEYLGKRVKRPWET